MRPQREAGADPGCGTGRPPRGRCGAGFRADAGSTWRALRRAGHAAAVGEAARTGQSGEPVSLRVWGHRLPVPSHSQVESSRPLRPAHTSRWHTAEHTWL